LDVQEKAMNLNKPRILWLYSSAADAGFQTVTYHGIVVVVAECLRLFGLSAVADVHIYPLMTASVYMTVGPKHFAAIVTCYAGQGCSHYHSTGVL
jgi:hypothetical protein